MQEQYVGDINDYRKYALLRSFADAGLRIGVCWMLTVPRDGQKRSYLCHPERWKEPDPELFDLLKGVMRRPEKSRLTKLQALQVVPGAVYFDAALPVNVEKREEYFRRANEACSDCDLVFLDPDNGLERRTQRGTPNATKYVYFDEVRSFTVCGKSVLIYQHYPYEERGRFVRNLLRRLSKETGGLITQAFRTPHVAFLLALQPRHKKLLSVDYERLRRLKIESEFLRTN